MGLGTKGSCYLLAAGLAVAAALAGCSEYDIYWGDVHGHTACSDGKGTVAEYLTCARDEAGLDFVIVTDHDFGNAAPWRLAPEVWTATQEAVDAFTVDGEFIAIAGYEWTSQPKYWEGFKGDTPSERLFEGPPKYYNHKVVYVPDRVSHIFSAKDRAYKTPDSLAGAVRQVGGLIHNAHPGRGLEGRDQWDYSPASAEVIANTEIRADVVWYEGKKYDIQMEKTLREYLVRGGKTGIVYGTDTHEGKPAARTAVIAPELTRGAIFEALRRRRCYAVSNARIRLDFKINGHCMGQEIEIEGKPSLWIEILGTDIIKVVEIIRDGAVLRRRRPDRRSLRFGYVDESFESESFYYVRVTQADTDEHGNLSRAWSSPIWVKAKGGVSQGEVTLRSSRLERGR